MRAYSTMKEPLLEIKNDLPFGGFSATSASAENETILVYSVGVFGPESGSQAADYCESFFNDGRRHSHLSSTKTDWGSEEGVLVLLSRNGHERYWTFSPRIARIQIKHAADKGQDIGLDSIGDIESIDLSDYPVRDAEGYLLAIRFGFHRAIAFQTPVSEINNQIIERFDIEKMAGMALSLIVHRKRYGLVASHVSKLLTAGWFPFLALSESSIQKLQICADTNSGWEVITESVVQEWAGKTWPQTKPAWSNVPHLRDEVPFVDRATALIINGDALSAYSLLIPRLEGLAMRLFGPTNSVSRAHRWKDDLVVAGQMKSNPISTYFSVQFKAYLEQVIFRRYRLGESTPAVGRHSFAHGAISADQVTKTHAIQALYALHQISSYRL